MLCRVKFSSACAFALPLARSALHLWSAGRLPFPLSLLSSPPFSHALLDTEAAGDMCRPSEDHEPTNPLRIMAAHRDDMCTTCPWQSLSSWSGEVPSTPRMNMNEPVDRAYLLLTPCMCKTHGASLGRKVHARDSGGARVDLSFHRCTRSRTIPHDGMGRGCVLAWATHPESPAERYAYAHTALSARHC